MLIDQKTIDQARDDLILATAVALERLVEVVSTSDERDAIKANLSGAQGRLMATITRFSSAREGKL